MMCRLFTDFDRAILSCGLFKMDTVGDAYIAAGFFPVAKNGHSDSNKDLDTDHEGSITAASRVCQDILNLAGSMLAAVAQYRAETGKEIHCRIGISAGPILAGVLGRLQPRFHIFGQGIRKAERKEQSGEAGAVHVSENFMLLVFGTAPPSAAEGFQTPFTVKSCGGWVIRDKCDDAENDESENEEPSVMIDGLSGMYLVPNGQPLESSGDISYDDWSKIKVAVSGKDSESDLNGHSLCAAVGSEYASNQRFSTAPSRSKQRRRSFLLFPYKDKADLQESPDYASSYQEDRMSGAMLSSASQKLTSPSFIDSEGSAADGLLAITSKNSL